MNESKLFEKHLRNHPDFFIIGAMKAGTTSMFQYLNFHSGLESSSIKEPCYFSYNYNKGLNWYLSFFPKKMIFQKRKLYFDASPVYLHDPLSPERIFKEYPKAKLIIIMRDPIERAISHYNYYSDRNSNFSKKNEDKIDTRTIEEAFEDDINEKEKRKFHKYCRMGLYSEQINHFLKYFSLNQMLLIDSKELSENTVKVMFDVADFVGLKDKEQFIKITTENKKVKSQDSFSKDSSKEFKKFNSMDYSITISDELTSQLNLFYKEDVSNLVKLSGRQFSWTSKYLL